MKTVEKLWGKEVWLVNCPEYCGKLLHIHKGCQSSYHYHPKKQETFHCLKGQVDLDLDGIHYWLIPETEPVTIMPGQPHSFLGIDNESVVVEISTTHDDEDVVRLTESRDVDGKRRKNKRSL